MKDISEDDFFETLKIINEENKDALLKDRELNKVADSSSVDVVVSVGVHFKQKT